MTDPFAPNNLTISPERPQTYLGRGMGWPFAEDPETGDIQRSVGYSNINQCITHLLQINFFGVPGLETMGTNAEELLFDNDPRGMSSLFRRSALKAVKLHETRVDVIELAVNFEPIGTELAGRYRLSIRIKYRIKANGDVVTNVFPFDSIAVSGDIS